MLTDELTAQSGVRARDAVIAELAQLVRLVERDTGGFEESQARASSNRNRSSRKTLPFVLYIAAVVLLAGVVAGEGLGYRLLVIKSGSMTPTLAVGALVVSRQVRPLDVHPGDIVTFRDPAFDQQLVTHRVISMHRHGTDIDFVTKGDANHSPEKWRVPIDATIGKERLVVPAAGRLLRLIIPIALTALIAIAALWIISFALRRVWASTRRPTHYSAHERNDQRGVAA